MAARKLTKQEALELGKQLHRWDILSEFTQARKYLKRFIELLELSEQEQEKFITAKSITENKTAEEHFQTLDENTLEHQRAFPRILRRTAIMQLCSIVEIKLLVISEKLQAANRAKPLADYLKENPSRESLPKRIAGYIFTIAGVKIDEIKGWSTLCDIFEIRHIIVHEGGAIKTAKSMKSNEAMIIRLTKKYRRHGSIEIQHGPYLYPPWIVIDLSFEICDFFVGEMQSYFTAILDKLGAPFS